MADLDALLALVAAQDRARARLATNAIHRLGQLVAAMGGRWYDPQAVQQLAEDMASLVRAGQTLTAGITGGYIDQVLLHLDVPVPAGSVTLPAVNLRGVDPLVQWERPAKVYRRAVAEGADPARATGLAALRASLMAQDDLTLAMRVASRQRLDAAPHVTGFRRVLRASTSSCDLCVSEAGELYPKSVLLPTHGRCHCTVMPVVSGTDAAQAMNAAKTSTPPKVRVAVGQHGELGPLMHDARHDFRTHSEAISDLNNPSDASI